MLVADAQPMYVEALEHAVKQWSSFELVGCIAAEAFLGELQRLQPDVALVDPVGLSGADLAAVLELASGPTRVLFLSANPDQSAIYTAIQAGVASYLCKDCDAGELCRAINATAHGRDILSAGVQRALISEARLRERPDRPLFTDREKQVLDLVGDGKTIPQIAKELGLRPTTVKTHLNHVYEKLGAHGRTEAVRNAMRLGLIE